MERKGDLPQARAGCGAGMIGKRMVVAGGSYWDGDQEVLDGPHGSVRSGTNTWSPGAPMPQPRSDAASATFRGSIYVFGGVAGWRTFKRYPAVRWEGLESVARSETAGSL